jgi:hypothetical protein
MWNSPIMMDHIAQFYFQPIGFLRSWQAKNGGWNHSFLHTDNK